MACRIVAWVEQRPMQQYWHAKLHQL
jgi:hypothetical protein